MPWTHIWAPSKGMITNVPSTLLPKEASPWIKGMYCKDGEVISDFGYVDYPTCGATASNELLGSAMRVDQFYRLDGNSSLIAMTTTSLYYYLLGTWKDITFGIELDDCEDAWTDRSGDTTCSADTTYHVTGTKSSKMIVPAAVTQEMIASWNTTSDLDCSAHRYLHFWVYLTVATTADQIRFRISEDDDGGTSNTYCDWDIGALAKDKWHHVSIDLDGTADADNAYTDHSDLDSVDSVALYLQDTAWVGTVYIDDVRIVTQFTGDEDDRFSVATMDDTFIITNGLDQPGKITASGTTLTIAQLTTSLAAGSITTSEIVITAKDHIVFFNNTENGADVPQRATWGDIGQVEQYTGGTSGYQDLVDDESWVIAVEQLGENEWAVYKERSIVKMYWVGGHTPFRFRTMVTGTGALSKEAVTSVGGEHMVIGPDVVYAYKGDNTTEVIDDVIKKTMYDQINDEFSNRVFLLFLEEDDELQVWIPTDTDYPDTVWCMDVVKEIWYQKARTMMGFGYYQSTTAITIGSLVGTIGEQTWRFGDRLVKAYRPITLVGDRTSATMGKVYRIDKSTLNNDGTAITSVFETPDFVLPDTPDYMNKTMRVKQLLFEARGHSVDTSYSTDGGASWKPTQASNTTTLSSAYPEDPDQQDFDSTSRKIRFRFMNDTVTSGFRLRYYGFYWLLRSGRR